MFIEEDKAVIASNQSSFSQWDQNPMYLKSLDLMRRSFHTLKGSGRMVGARSIAEFGWSIENLLNRIIDKTLSRTPGMMTLLRRRSAAIGGTAGNRTAQSRSDRGADGACLRLCRRPGGGASHHGIGTG